MSKLSRMCKLRLAKWVFATIVLVSLGFSVFILKDRDLQDFANVVCTFSLLGFVLVDGIRVNRSCPREE